MLLSPLHFIRSHKVFIFSSRHFRKILGTLGEGLRFVLPLAVFGFRSLEWWYSIPRTALAASEPIPPPPISALVFFNYCSVKSLPVNTNSTNFPQQFPLNSAESGSRSATSWGCVSTLCRTSQELSSSFIIGLCFLLSLYHVFCEAAWKVSTHGASLK